MLCERLQGPFVPSGVVTSSGPAKSSQDDAQRTRRPVQLPACSSPVRRRFGFFFRSVSFLPSRKYWTRKYWQGLQGGFIPCVFLSNTPLKDTSPPFRGSPAPLFLAVRPLFVALLCFPFARRLRRGLRPAAPLLPRGSPVVRPVFEVCARKFVE